MDSIEKIDPSKIPKIFAGVLHTGKIKQVAVGSSFNLKYVCTQERSAL